MIHIKDKLENIDKSLNNVTVRGEVISLCENLIDGSVILIGSIRTVNKNNAVQITSFEVKGHLVDEFKTMNFDKLIEMNGFLNYVKYANVIFVVDFSETIYDCTEVDKMELIVELNQFQIYREGNPNHEDNDFVDFLGYNQEYNQNNWISKVKHVENGNCSYPSIDSFGYNVLRINKEQLNDFMEKDKTGDKALDFFEIHGDDGHKYFFIEYFEYKVNLKGTIETVFNTCNKFEVIVVNEFELINTEEKAQINDAGFDFSSDDFSCCFNEYSYYFPIINIFKNHDIFVKECLVLEKSIKEKDFENCISIDDFNKLHVTINAIGGINILNKSIKSIDNAQKFCFGEDMEHDGDLSNVLYKYMFDGLNNKYKDLNLLSNLILKYDSLIDRCNSLYMNTDETILHPCTYIDNLRFLHDSYVKMWAINQIIVFIIDNYKVETNLLECQLNE